MILELTGLLKLCLHCPVVKLPRAPLGARVPVCYQTPFLPSTPFSRSGVLPAKFVWDTWDKLGLGLVTTEVWNITTHLADRQPRSAVPLNRIP
jgi:hypothetical protein